MRTGVLALALSCCGTLTSARADALTREGYVEVRSGTRDGEVRSSVWASFGDLPPEGLEVARDGACSVRRRVRRPSLSAGLIAVTGLTRDVLLAEAHDPTQPTYHQRFVGAQLFGDNATIAVTGGGGADVGAFTATVHAQPAITGFAPPAEVRRDGYRATWTAVPGSQIALHIVATAPEVRDGDLDLVCAANDAGEVAVPASLLSMLPANTHKVWVELDRVDRHEQAVGDVRVVVEASSFSGHAPVRLVAPPRPTRTVEVWRTAAEATWEMSISAGQSGTSRVGTAPPAFGFGWQWRFGQRLGTGIHLVEEIGGGAATPLASATDVGTIDHTYLDVGLRWQLLPDRSGTLPFPFHIYPGVMTWGVYLLTTAGVDAGPLSGNAPMVSATLGLSGLRGRDWTLGFEFREQVARVSDTLQRAWMLGLALTVY